MLLSIAILKSVEVKLHVAHIPHRTHVEELLEVIVRAGAHVMVLPIPGSGAHHDGDV
jgi:hypothetical protein